MKIVVAPDSFKDSLSAVQACEAIERGIRKGIPRADIVKIPLADGGEGTLEALVNSTGGTTVSLRVTGPLGNPLNARFGILGDGDTAVVEMAQASGLMLVPTADRNPVLTTSYGTGELIRAALERSSRRIIVCIGGSATTDCGTGMAQALGIRFLRTDGTEISTPMCGGLMAEAERIDVSGMHPAVPKTKFLVACDVQNPLLGEKGAVMVYSRQKGADDGQLALLENNMRHLIGIVEKTVNRSLRDIPGTGAAGGLAVPLIAFANAELRSGIRLVLEASRFPERIQGADLILTGEGQVDGQTAFGKTIRGVADEAGRQSIPVVVLAGSIKSGAETLYTHGVVSMFSICSGPMTLDQAVRNAGPLIEDAAERIIRLYRIHGEGRPTKP